jgi:chaperone required for assembly of F1-ATPase
MGLAARAKTAYLAPHAGISRRNGRAMKRFWQQTAVAANAAGYAILLDGRPLKLPNQAVLTVPLEGLAGAIAREWGEAGEMFTPDDLPLTRLAGTAQDHMSRARDETIRQLAAYGATDLLCYRSSEPALAAHESQAWQPWLDWAAARYGVILACTTGLMPIDQSSASHERCLEILGTMNNYELAGLGAAVPALGSLVLGLALAAADLAPSPACDLAHLGELWQEARWGADAQALSRRKKIAEDLAHTARFMMLCRP